MRGYAALDSDRPLQDDRSLVLSAVDSMVSESLVQTTSLERQMAVAVAERATERDSGTHMTHICVYMCMCVWNLYARCPTDDVTRLRSRVFEVIIFFCCQRSNTLEHYAADTLPPQCLFVTLDEAICCYTRWLRGGWSFECVTVDATEIEVEIALFEFGLRWINNKANGSLNRIKGRF